MALFKKKAITDPIYSDSTTAIAWIKSGRCKTDHARQERNERLFELIDRAEQWLAENDYPNKILKWVTATDVSVTL